MLFLAILVHVFSIALDVKSLLCLLMPREKTNSFNRNDTKEKNLTILTISFGMFIKNQIKLFQSRFRNFRAAAASSNVRSGEVEGWYWNVFLQHVKELNSEWSGDERKKTSTNLFGVETDNEKTRKSRERNVGVDVKWRHGFIWQSQGKFLIQTGNKNGHEVRQNT